LWEKSIPQNLTAGRQLNSIFGAFCYGRVVCVSISIGPWANPIVLANSSGQWDVAGTAGQA